MQLHFYRYQLPLDIDLNIFTFPISLVLLKVIYYNTGPHLLKKRNIFTFLKLFLFNNFFFDISAQGIISFQIYENDCKN